MTDFMQNFNDIYNSKCSAKFISSTLPATKRIIVIGDIHGDMSMLIKCLIVAKLIKKNNIHKWTGKDTIVVQVGDQIDSCRYNGIDKCNDPNTYTPENDFPNDVNILYYMTRLHNEAQKSGGAIYSIMGNHEFMNVAGDMSYVSHMNIASFNNYTTPNGQTFDNALTARKHAFAPGNEIANFLACTRRIALIIGSNLFVHAGVVPYIAQKYKIDDMNKILILYLFNEINNPKTFNDLFISSTLSPLWTRVFGMRIDNCIELLQPLQDIYNVNRIFVGHTPQIESGITSQCQNKVWLTDAGMSNAFDIFFPKHLHKGREAQVLEILNDNEFNILRYD
jgi:hypothetical protein